MTRYYILVTLFLLSVGIGAFAQDSIRTRKKSPDSLYLQKFDDWFVIKTSVVNTAEALVAKTGDFNIELQPNTSEVIRTYFNYQFISFYFDYAPKSAITNNDDLEKGRTKLFNIGGNFNSRNWFANLNYSHTKGYYVANTKTFRPDWSPGDPYLQVPDLHLTSYDASIGYNTNSHLSLAAAASQTERQIKSTGGFLPRATFRYYIVNDRTPGSANAERSTNLQALIGAGYQYTLVLNESVYFIGGFTPSFGYIYTRVRQGSNGETYRFTEKGPIYQWDGKLGLGYNGYRFFAGTYLTAVSAKYSQGLTSAENRNANIFFQVFVGLRLKAPKIVSNTYNRIFKKMIKKYFIGFMILLACQHTYGQVETDSSSLPKRRFGRAAAELFVVELLPWTYDKYITKADWARLDLKSIGSNLNPKNWEWDDNSFKTNQFGHPYHGNLYYSTFRTNGFSFWQSAPAAFAGSFVWEVAAETNKFAPNDFINTSLGGITLGEMTYRVSRKVVNNRSRGVKRQMQEVFGLLINPLNGINRLIDGKWGKVAGEVDTAYKLHTYIDAGIRHFDIKSYRERIKGQQEIYLRLRLLYGEKYKESRVPFEHFTALLELGSGDSTYVNNVQVSGALKTWEMNDPRHFYTINMNYDFIKNRAFQYGGQSFTFKLISDWNPESKVKYTTEIGSGVIALGAVPDKYLFYGEGRNYDYCAGINVVAGGTMTVNNRIEAAISYRGSRFQTINGNPSSYILNTISADIRGYLTKRFSIAAGVGQYTLNGFFKGFDNVAEVYPFARFSAGCRF